MTWGSRLAAVSALACIVLSPPAMADALFVVFEKPSNGALAVKGDSLDDAMAKLGALEVDQLGFGIQNALVIDPADNAIGPGRATLKPLAMTLPLGPGVPALLQTAGAGGHYGDVTVHLRTSGNQPVEYATLSLKTVVVSSVEISASSGGSPQATVVLTYGAMKLDVYAQDTKGTVATEPETGAWNAMTNSAGAKP
jgi:type VI protein secretion system component Hcp